MQIPPRDMPTTGYLGDFLVYVAVCGVFAALAWWYFRRRPKERRNLVVGNLIVLGTLLAGVVTTGEAYFRYVYDATDSYGLTVTNWCWMKRHCGALNSLGFRMREITVDGAVPPPGEGVTRVAFVGDSFTFGYGVPDAADLFPQRIEAALRAREPGAYEVWNLGVIGWNTPDHERQLEDILPASNTHHVVLGYCLNDIEDLLPRQKRFLREATPQLPWIAPWRSFLADTLWFRLGLHGDARVGGYFEWVQEAYESDEIWPVQEERFARIADHSKRHGVRLSVVVFPLFGAWGDDYPLGAAHDRVASGWAKHGAEVLDLRAAYAGHSAEELVVNRYDAHPNEVAHRIAAEAILETLFPRRDGK